MIVSVPQIAANVPPAKAPVSSTAQPVPFSTVLAQAADNGGSAKPILGTRSSNNGQGNLSSKNSGKSGSKTNAFGNPVSGAQSVTADASTVAPNNLNSKPFPSFATLQTAPGDGEVDEPAWEGNSSAADKSTSLTSLIGVGSAVVGAGSVHPVVSASTESLKGATDQASALTPDESLSAAMGKLPIPSETSTPISPSSGNTPTVRVSPAVAKAASQGKNPVVDPSLALLSTQANSKVPSRDAAHDTPAETKVSAPPAHQTTVADVPALPAPQPVTATSDLSPNTQHLPSTSGNTNVPAAPSVSDSSKKDDANGQNPPSQSGKQDSPAQANGTTAKPTSIDAQVQSIGSPQANLAGANPSSQVALESKPPANVVPVKVSDAKGTSPAQPASADTEAIGEVASANLASPIQMAKLVERAGQAELRVGIQAGEFGSVDIRTSMARSQFTAEIAVERGDLGRALAAELPSLHERLAEQRVPPANIVLQDQSNNGGHGSGDFRQGPRQNQYATANLASSSSEAEPNAALAAMETLDDRAGVDIHI